MKMQKEYTGSAYIGVVGADHEYGEARDSISALIHFGRDEGPHFARATKGYESRQHHLNEWYQNTAHPFMILLDADMVFSADTLVKLRAHKLPYVSGLYMRRRVAPVAPVWYKPFGGQWPMEVWTDIPERGKLHPLGASGWGCILLHRDVVTAVRTLLKGEWDILEDDMDIWPYDLARIMGALGSLREIARTKPDASIAYPALSHHLAILEDEIKPLRADHDIIGSDIRFPFFAAKAGFQLMGDPDIRPAHILDYQLVPDDFEATPPEHLQEFKANMSAQVKSERARIVKAKRGLK